MKRNLLFLLILTFVFYLGAELDNSCLERVKEKLKPLIQGKHSRFTNAKTAKTMVNKIIEELKTCGLPGSELNPFLEYRKAVIRDIDKHARKKSKLPTVFAAKKIKSMIDEIEGKYSTEDPSQTGEDKPIQEKPLGEDSPNAKKRKKIVPSFPSEDFEVKNEKIAGEKPFVVTANELKIQMELMKKKIKNLSGTVNFYHLGFIISIIALFVIFATQILLVLYLRNNHKKMKELDYKVTRIRKKEDYHL